ncbi:MAG: GTPase domain-containing protein [Myxococcales bacterium]|nr:GTPase domain-containing protein [Myxococcales bacterium]MCB9669624.1 GTPase domain-containing protein [Alphaproteobacteria bacterium]
MRIQAAKRLMTLKVVYYGPGLSGKTTNLHSLHALTADTQRGALVQLDTETERTLFFDYFPVVLGKIAGFRVKVDFFTVPGQSFYTATRKAVLQDADGIVFVADSGSRREEANLQSREDMVETLASMGRTLEDVPHVYQWNKRDLDDVLPLRVMNAQLNPEGATAIEAVASAGTGVMETQKAILAEVVKAIQAELKRARHA